MVDETSFFEIYFSREGVPVSVLTLDSLTGIVTVFSETCKRHVAETLAENNMEKVVLCENFKITQESIRKNHTLFPHDTWYLIPSEDGSTLVVYYKTRTPNSTLYVWTTNPTTVIPLGTFGVRKLKIGDQLANKFVEINAREDYAETQLADANRRCLSAAKQGFELTSRENKLYAKEADFHVREKALDRRIENTSAHEKNLCNYAKDLKSYAQQLDQTKEELVSWENDLISWESFLDTREKSQASRFDEMENEINFLKTKVLAYEIIDNKVQDYEVKNREYEKTIAALQKRIDELEDDSDDEVVVYIATSPKPMPKKTAQPFSIQRPHVYMDELKDFFAKHWRRYDSSDDEDTSYLEHIEKNIHRTDIAYGKVKSD